MSFKRRRSESDDSDLLLTPQEWEERAREVLLARLSRGPRSKHQLAVLLENRGVPEEISEMLLNRFTEVGLIDDAAFALAFTRDKRSSRGLAKSALKRELASVGISQEHSEAALETIDSSDDLQLAIRLVEKRWYSVARLESDARYRRLGGFLARRGFPSGIISTAIKTVERSEQFR
jgi:regulatory protein